MNTHLESLLAGAIARVAHDHGLDVTMSGDEITLSTGEGSATFSLSAEIEKMFGVDAFAVGEADAYRTFLYGHAGEVIAHAQMRIAGIGEAV